MTAKRLLPALLLLAALPAAADVLVDCLEGQPIGDGLERGFYVPDFPGGGIERVDLVFETTVSGPKRIRLSVRADAYDGPLIAEAVAQPDLIAGLETPVSFIFPVAPVPAGAAAAFALTLEGGEGEVFYGVLTSECDCPVIQTHGTTPPLDEHRRDGVRVRIFGPVGTPAEDTAWGRLKAAYR